MKETVLYRKYRPQTFAEVVGQEHIVRVLEGALKSGRINHAYLFAGSRGTGKTSVARILARALGCEEVDLYEIDGASNRGIGEVRALREAVQTFPFRSPVKVYIIDEVHMLTTPAFNALLKTLEEPPDHVVFILATTELHQVPETIVSRCQYFLFRRPGLNELSGLVKDIAGREKYGITSEAATLIGVLAEGSFRDAAGILQKVIAAAAGEKGGRGTINESLVEMVTGAPSARLIGDFVSALLAGEAGRGLALVRELAERHGDFQVFIKLALRPLRQALFWRLWPEAADKLRRELSADEVEFLRKIKDDPKVKRLPRVLRALLGAHEETARAAVPELPLELAILSLAGEDQAAS